MSRRDGLRDRCAPAWRTGVEHHELRLNELLLREAGKRFRREHESELSRLLAVDRREAPSLRVFVAELWDSARGGVHKSRRDARNELAPE
jgi:hypothetical protein